MSVNLIPKLLCKSYLSLFFFRTYQKLNNQKKKNISVNIILRQYLFTILNHLHMPPFSR